MHLVTSIAEPQAEAIGVDAYMYFFPLVTMDVTRRQSTNIESSKTREQPLPSLITQ